MKKALVFLMVLVLALAQFAIAEGESPLAGLAVKEDGTPMVLGYILNAVSYTHLATRLMVSLSLAFRRRFNCSLRGALRLSQSKRPNVSRC